ncbi:hypothetical protein W822_21800 [Advenella kashmirensis W13003]|uniref:Lipoprotein n=1 Tax=Advenella kashmirensis W13003 TaxID=1424334 RepID=V8QN28_9BURK|nr:hypothetical protein [Advenella kashmirensis]ETF00399.1 hypothetical protein W822_21800 [Advenella kashmirensis W13003]
MPMRALTRYGFVLFLLTSAVGCGTSREEATSTASAPITKECSKRSSCIFKGSYESGERKFAEEEARRLNKAQTLRLTKSVRTVKVVSR